MNIDQLVKINDFAWKIEPHDKMRVPAIIFASRDLIEGMDQKVFEQIRNVAMLPGIVKAAYAMPDAHWGYGFPIGGVAAFDPKLGGVISAGGVGFDISCGVRMLATNLLTEEIYQIQAELADALYAHIPAGVGSKSHIRLNVNQINDVLMGGAKWAVKQGYGIKEDLEYIEEQGCMAGAIPENVSMRAKNRQQPEMGTLGSGNHYLEVQHIEEIYDEKAAEVLGLNKGEVVISIHCGSRGLGHQIGTEFLKEMAVEAHKKGIFLPDRELACAPILSDLGQSYLGAMRSGINCALANRQILTHFTRQVFENFFPKNILRIVYDVSHNTCKEEDHMVDGQKRSLFVHRKGATRAFGPHTKGIPSKYAEIGQPVFIGGSMGTASYVLVGKNTSEEQSFGSACHGAGRAMSRTQASKRWRGKELMEELAKKRIFIRSDSYRGIAEEAPDAYKNVTEVVDAAAEAGLSTKVALLRPIICVKG
ncbi:MAG: RtcB family protein [Candidatus Berkiellales bacterium]